MRVHELIAHLRDAPRDALVVVPGDDHSYRDRVSVNITTGLYHRSNGWSEDQGESITSEAEYGKRIDIVVIEG